MNAIGSKGSARGALDWFLLVLIGCVFAAAWFFRPPALESNDIGFERLQGAKNPSAVPVYRERLASRSLDSFVHSPALVALQNGDLISAWFSGTREGAKDVVIRASRFDSVLGQWGDEQVIKTRQQTSQATSRYIRKLGNPSLGQAPDGTVWLFYVSVSMGGWSQSGINVVRSQDNGRTWSAPQRLMLTPFWNVSTLVRSPPIFLSNGYVGLPVYHEMFGKFSEYVILNSEGQVVDKVRMGTGGRIAIQPAVVPLTEQKAVALFRYSGDGPRKLYGGFTENAGLAWSAPRALSPDNPNSAVAAVPTAMPDWPVVVAQNDQPKGRFRISLYLANHDLNQWQQVFVPDSSPNQDGALPPFEDFTPLIRKQYLAMADAAQQQVVDEAVNRISSQMCENGKTCDFDFEYPSMAVGPDGAFHLVYAWNDTLIKHVSFNRAWLSQQLQNVQGGK